MNDSWKNISELIGYSEGGILSKEMVKSENGGVTLFSMAKNTEISEHTSTKEGLVYIIEGEGVFSLEGKDIAMRPGVSIFLKKSVRHSIKAKENTSFLLFLI
jgi:nitric oxide dioxygenase